MMGWWCNLHKEWVSEKKYRRRCRKATRYHQPCPHIRVKEKEG